MGFRGEALPSIASVADVELTTAIADATAGRTVHLRGGKLVTNQPAPTARRGTDVRVAELFFNTPARLKYLKSPRRNWLELLILSTGWPSLTPGGFSFTHNGKKSFGRRGTITSSR